MFLETGEERMRLFTANAVASVSWPAMASSPSLPSNLSPDPGFELAEGWLLNFELLARWLGCEGREVDAFGHGYPPSAARKR
jgi:hypothetical protein